MNQNENKEKKLWWETEVPAIRRDLEAYLRRRFPAIRIDHDDLISETLLSLTQHILRYSSTLPESWFDENLPSEDERIHLHKLSMVILKARVADNFRKRIHVYDQSLETHETNLVDPHSITYDRKILLTRVIEVVRLALDEMSPEDRDLIALTQLEGAPRTPLNSRDRQRLHRIRKSLKHQINRRLGSDVSEILKISA